MLFLVGFLVTSRPLAYGQGVLKFGNSSVPSQGQNDYSSSAANFHWFNFCFDSKERSNSADGLTPISSLPSQNLLECRWGKNIHLFISIAVGVNELIEVNCPSISIKVNSGVGAIASFGSISAHM